MTSISIEERTSGDAVHTTTPYPGMPSDPVNTDYDSVVVHGMNPLLAYNSARNVDYFGADFAGDTALEFPSVDTQTQRKAHNNKLAQRRARARKKTHAQAVEAQLAVASAELQQLQSKQKALEARNSLLEKIVQLEHAQQPSDCVAPAANFVSSLCHAYLFQFHVSSLIHSVLCRIYKKLAKLVGLQSCLAQQQTCWQKTKL